MDPSKHEAAPFKLPEVQTDDKELSQSYEAAVKNADEKATSKAIEQNNLNNALSKVSSQPVNPVAADPLAMTDPSVMVPTGTTPRKIAVTDDLTANDTDLIEKAWVTKAKALVEQTKNDPYEQTNEIKKIREDYQSKRFKTNLKLDKE
jgi:hypothetical protein